MGIEQIGRITAFNDTQSNVQAATGALAEMRFAWATDGELLGVYAGGAWHWLGGETTGELLVDDDMNILFGDDGDILYEE
jgi:hypothetical protein